MKNARSSGNTIDRDARAAATRYVEDPAFRAAFDTARAELARQRLETVRLAAEGLGYALVPSEGAATLSAASVSAAASASQPRATRKARATKAKASAKANAVTATAKSAARGATSAKPSGAAKPKRKAAKGNAADAVVAFLAEHPGSRKGELAEGTGLALGSLTAALRALRKAKRIVKKGKTRAAIYSVK